MKKLKLLSFLIVVVLGALSLAGPAAAQAPSADEIMKRVEDRNQGDDFEAQVTLETTRDDQTKSLTLEMKTLLYDKTNMNYKVLVVVEAPEDSEGLAFLAWENEYPQVDDFWLFLPALNQVKRVEPENSRQSLFGSVFNYQDATRRPAGADAHTLLGTESIDGRETWKIESVPHDAATVEFGRRVVWVDQESLIIIKEELYDKQKGDLLRRFSLTEQRQIDGIWTAIRASVENVQTETASTYLFADIEYNTGIDESLFDPDTLGE